MLGQYCGLMASLQNLFDKQSICNNSIGILSGIPRPAWVVPRAQHASNNQILNNATKENNVHTASGQAAETIVATPAARTPFPLPSRPPTAVGLSASQFQTDAAPAATVLDGSKVQTSTSTAVVPKISPPARSRSFSDVQADIRSLVPDIGAAQVSRAVTEPIPRTVTGPGSPMGGILGTTQAVTPQPGNIAPEDPATFTMKPQQQQPPPPQGKKQQELGSQRVRELVAAEAHCNFLNPRFVTRDIVYDTRVFANECCRVRGNPIFGRRLVLFSDGSHCTVTRTASAAVVFRRFYDMSTKTEPPWAKESYGVLRLTHNKFETIALMAALEIVQHEAKVFFASTLHNEEPLRVYLFTDSTSAMSDLEQVATCTVREDKQKKNPHMLHLMKIWRDLHSDVHNGRLKLEVHWVKGHIGAEGNEFADILAAKTIEVTKKLHFARPASSPLGQGYEVFPLWQMEQDLLSQSIIRSQAAAITHQPPPVAEGFQKAEETFIKEEEDRAKKAAQQDSLGQIRKIFADFFAETRKNAEKQNRHAIDELRKELDKQPKQIVYQQDVTKALKINRADLQEMLRKELSKPPKESPQLEQAIKSQTHNRLAFDELRIEIGKQNRRQDAQDAQIESLMMALEEASSEWRDTLAAQCREIKALRQEGQEMLRAMREETRDAIKVITQAVAARNSVKHTGCQTDEASPAMEEKPEKVGLAAEAETNDDETRSTTAASSEKPAVDPEQVTENVASCVSSEESHEIVRTSFEDAVSNFGQSGDLARQELAEEEEQTDDNSSTPTSSRTEQPETFPVEAASAVANPESADETATTCNNSEEESRETASTAFEVAPSCEDHSDVESEGHDVIEQVDQEDTGFFAPAEPAVLPEVIDLVVDADGPNDTAASCASSEGIPAAEVEELEDIDAAKPSESAERSAEEADAVDDPEQPENTITPCEGSEEVPVPAKEEWEDDTAFSNPARPAVVLKVLDAMVDSGRSDDTTISYESAGDTPAAEQEEEENSPAANPAETVMVSAGEATDVVDDSGMPEDTIASFLHSGEPSTTEQEAQEDTDADANPPEPLVVVVSTPEEEAELVDDSETPEDTITTCSSSEKASVVEHEERGSGATVLGETTSRSTASDFREEDGGKTPGKLRRRDKLLQKLHVRWPGKKKSKDRS
ncbi:hypothetical protein PG997_006992 [Apiospora hydei]|uniref:RNase H type-1 domain-containing protein n=1 Tax=Apiospora hydei TaxID=1337664 RepID=A0ABR1WQA1_9PEZI